MSYHVLIVEDQNPFILQNFLEAYGGFACVISKRGDEAIELFASGNFDGVVLDLRLPVMDGFTVLQAIRKISPDVPVIVVSSYGDANTRERASRLGASAFYNNPPNYQKLHTRLTELAAGWRFSRRDAMTQTINLDKHEVQAMARKRELVGLYRRLAVLKEQTAKYGSLDAPAHLTLEVEDLQNQIAELEMHGDQAE